jgi:hypothetical protein
MSSRPAVAVAALVAFATYARFAAFCLDFHHAAILSRAAALAAGVHVLRFFAVCAEVGATEATVGSPS